MTQLLRQKSRWKQSKGRRRSRLIAGEFGIHPNQIQRWRRQLLEMLPDLFSDRRKRVDKDRDDLESELFRQIGQLKVELDWLKKNLRSSCRKEASEG